MFQINTTLLNFIFIYSSPFPQTWTVFNSDKKCFLSSKSAYCNNLFLRLFLIVILFDNIAVLLIFFLLFTILFTIYYWQHLRLLGSFA